MLRIRDLRDGIIIATALGTVYGLGVLSCVYWEAKLFADFYKTSKTNSIQDEEES